MRTLIIDPKLAGISGDMILAALIDLTGRASEIPHLANIIEEELDHCEKFEVDVIDVKKEGIRAKSIKIKLIEKKKEVEAIKIKEYARKIGEKIGLSARSMSFALKVLDDLISAEAKVHGVDEASTHLHELASADTFLDVIGAACILEREKILNENVEIYATPPALGGGLVKTSHGLLPCPAPATIEILAKHKFRYSQTPIEVELTTPTGAAILVNLTSKLVDFYPPMKIERVGYGAGSKDLKGIPNILRVIEGQAFNLAQDKIVVLETTVDDATGEILGYLIERLIQKGALDVAIIPGVGKKNRPINVIKVLSRWEDHQSLIEVLMSETGTLGVRVQEIPRAVALREIRKITVKIRGRQHQINVKVSKTADGKILNIKPEYEDLKLIASELNIPLRQVESEVKRQLCKLMM
ncbi:MAG: nickel pincer cofactor biosynthesis protein LarC [archaeon GB-1867-005]|nr:nickel pincer cofactor biosynthesis protein LarC [Candidatus Culexmicrobium cathedralense]